MAERSAPTAAQHAAITAAGSAAVSAGAGCGKTMVLAERFVHLLRPGAGGKAPVSEVAQILAVTFTEKAAGEMKRRIRELVAAEIAQAPDGSRPHWERVRRELLGAQISTIHALCARILRDNPLEAGIDPHAVVLDEYESHDYLERVIEAELLRRLREGDGAAQALLARTRGLHGARGRGAVRTVARLLEAAARLGRDGAWLVAATDRATDPALLMPPLADAIDRFVDALEAWLAQPKPSKAARDVAADWAEWRRRIEALRADREPGDLLALLPLGSHVNRSGSPVLTELLTRKDERLDGRLAEAFGAVLAAPAARDIARLLADLDRVVAERKRADAVLSFDDLVSGARTVLQDHPAVARRYAGRFRAVLVDEFQDTDALQADVIAALAGGSASLFIVGDEKQSIYRFRGAEIAVFKAVCDRIGTTYPLGRNFRSQPDILAFVNLLAAAMFQMPMGAAQPEQWTRFEDAYRLEPHRAQTRRNPNVRLVTFAEIFARRKVQAREAREIEARVLAEVIHDLRSRAVDAVGYGDVAVLFRTLNQVKAYEYALARRGIPYHVVKGRGFFQAQEVRDLVNLLAAVAQPHDGTALAAVLRSPLFGVDDDTLWRLAWPADAERPDLARRFRDAAASAIAGPDAASVARAQALLGELRKRRSRSAIADLLVRALGATDLEAVYLTQFQGRQKVANVRKLIELARDFDRRGQGGIAEFVRRLRTLDADEPREAEAVLAGEHGDVVRLMTIHQAKGLEFPVVVLLDLGRALDADNDGIVLDREHGVIAVPVVGPGAHPLRNAGMEAHRAGERERSRAEYARLLYVACTRAADELVLLEGRGKASHLVKGDGDRDVWCHRIWDVIGRERVAEAARGSDVVVATPAPGVHVAIEPAGMYLARAEERAAEDPEPREAPPPPATLELVDRALRFAPPRPRELATTPTALATFRACPRQYWYRHVLGLDDIGPSGRRRKLAGLLAHGLLESVDFEAHAGVEELAALARTRPETLQLREREVARVVADLARATALVRRELTQGMEIVAREQPVVLAVPAGAPELVLHGRIDVLARRRGRLVVQDYKYARASSAHATEYAAQLDAYRLAVERAAGTGAAGEIVFLRGTPRSVALPALDAAALEAELLEAGRALGAVAGRRDREAFARRPAQPETCQTMGCAFVRRCWGADARAPLTGSGPSAPGRTDAA